MKPGDGRPSLITLGGSVLATVQCDTVECKAEGADEMHVKLYAQGLQKESTMLVMSYLR